MAGREPSRTVKVPLVTASLCHCGFSLMHDSIKVGTVFTIYPDTIDFLDMMTLQCGECGCVSMHLGSVFTNSIMVPDGPPSKLPLLLFDLGGIIK
jgi:hypothetical protein